MPSVSAAIAMQHDDDPKQLILDEVGALVADIDVMGAQVLVGVYRRPEKTAGGIHLPGSVRDEDNWQGKVGLVLKLGPLAFLNDDSHRWDYPPEVGDWVLFRVGDTFPWILNKRHCRFVEDVLVKAILRGSPDLVM